MLSVLASRLLSLVVAAGVMHTADDPVVVNAAWLRQHQDDPKVVVVTTSMMPDEFTQSHIRGARFLSGDDLMSHDQVIGPELPAPDAFRAALEKIGITDGMRLVVYGHPMDVGRLFYTLEWAGIPVMLLDGGLKGWVAAGGAVESGATAPATARRGSLHLKLRPEVDASADWLSAHLPDVAQGKLALLDTRSEGEYVGGALHRGVNTIGHIPGARLLTYQDLVSKDNDNQLLPRAELAKIYADRGAVGGKPVVTYCAVGLRGSFSYMVARYLGYDAKLYDGSYMDWANRKLPLVPGAKP
ncbi:MAG: putative thiosulfate sulfurtransferase [Gemmatimonadetes bacterium]|nr:putative thiosulfate sulfurtransferase [Gemmatimonadota bacterium]